MKYKQPKLFELDKRKGYKCECCGLYVREYVRTFNCNMGLALVLLMKTNTLTFVHLENFMQQHGYKRCGDASYLVHYGFFEKLNEKRKDNSPRNGYYRITGRGLAFASNKITAQGRFIIFNNECNGFEGKDVNIKDVLGKKFNYEQLMTPI